LETTQVKLIGPGPLKGWGRMGYSYTPGRATFGKKFKKYARMYHFEKKFKKNFPEGPRKNIWAPRDVSRAPLWLSTGLDGAII